MREAQVPRALCAAVLGMSVATVDRRLQPPVSRGRAQARVVDVAADQRVRGIVRATHGLVGAASLGKQCGLPRRAALAPV